MEPCGGCCCEGCVDWLPAGYCHANAPTAKKKVQVSTAILMLFIGSSSPSRCVASPECDACFWPGEGRPAHEGKLYAEILIEQHWIFVDMNLSEIQEIHVAGEPDEKSRAFFQRRTPLLESTLAGRRRHPAAAGACARAFLPACCQTFSFARRSERRVFCRWRFHAGCVPWPSCLRETWIHPA